MKKTINVFIPAAGLGERLQPITFHIPKPLLPVLGKPVLQSVLEKVSALPFNKIGVNIHYKKEAIKMWIRQSLYNERIVLFNEEEILGTGGALKNAEEFLGSGSFLVHNSDIISDMNLQGLLEHHLSSGNLITLAVHDFPKFNTVRINDKGFFKSIDNKNVPSINREGRKDDQRLAFTGVAVYEPEFLEFLPEGASSVVDAWLIAVNAGYNIGTVDVTGCNWSDIGTPEAYASAVFGALKSDGETVYIHTSVKGCSKVELQGYVVIEEGCKIDDGRTKPILRNCIFLPKSSVNTTHESHLENCIIGPDFKIELGDAGILRISEKDSGKQYIGTGGSDRKYFRINRDSGSAVLMECNSDDPDFDRHIEYTGFFMKCSVPVPQLIEVMAENKKALFEDAGDTSLYNWLKCPREESVIERMYKRVIDVLLLIHSSTVDVQECPLLRNRVFDREYFRWESDYFLERFVKGVKDINIESNLLLAEELNDLAQRGDSFPKTVIHRDFQAQNIMVKANGELRILDFQGARMAPPAYDIASILWDPYYRLQDKTRERLLDHYFDQLNEKVIFEQPGPDNNKSDRRSFMDSLIICRMQRHMQTLGAYGFLSTVKGKIYFLKYVPEGLRLLKEDISIVKDEYPELYKLVKRL